MLWAVWDTFLSSTHQQDAAGEDRDQSRDVFSKHPQMLPNMPYERELGNNSPCQGTDGLPLTTRTSENRSQMSTYIGKLFQTPVPAERAATYGVCTRYLSKPECAFQDQRALL